MLNVEGGLSINDQGGLAVAANASVDVSGNLSGDTTSAAGFNVLGTVVLRRRRHQQLAATVGGHVAGPGRHRAGVQRQLRLQHAGAYARHVCRARGRRRELAGRLPEALYVNDLIVSAGTTLNLNGLNLYIHTAQIQGTIIGGAIVTGEVYDDVSGSGTFSSGDPGLAGWTVNLTNTSNDDTYTTTTDSNGDYAFAGVPAGTYTLSEVLQSGFAQTQPASPGTYTLTITSGQVITGEEFGDHPMPSVSGVVFNDLNGDGTLESGEPGLEGWTVNLLNSASQVINTATTATNGGYSFTSLLPGTYTVQVVSQSGYVASSAASVTITDDNGAADTVNFGEFAPVTISGEVFDDPTDSGQFSSGDTGLSGWTVELVQGSNVLQTTSGSDGATRSQRRPRKLDARGDPADGLGGVELAHHHHADERDEHHQRGPRRVSGARRQRSGVRRHRRQRHLRIGRPGPRGLDHRPPERRRQRGRHGPDQRERRLHADRHCSRSLYRCGSSPDGFRPDNLAGQL